jgi:hypothetical protein
MHLATAAAPARAPTLTRDSWQRFPRHDRRNRGQGDRPLKDLKFRCAKCGSRMTDAVMMGKGGMGVQPWRQTE